MVVRETHQVEFLNDSVNDVRTNIIQALSNLYKRFENIGSHQVRYFENYKLTFQPGLMTIEGCIDEIRIFGNRCSDVHLGGKIHSYGHVPLEWINTLEI